MARHVSTPSTCRACRVMLFQHGGWRTNCSARLYKFSGFMLLHTQILFVPSSTINVYSNKLVDNLHIITLYKLHNKLICESSSSCRARHVEYVEPCCLTSSTANMTSRTCRRDVTSQVELELILCSFVLWKWTRKRKNLRCHVWKYHCDLLTLTYQLLTTQVSVIISAVNSAVPCFFCFSEPLTLASSKVMTNLVTDASQLRLRSADTRTLLVSRTRTNFGDMASSTTVYDWISVHQRKIRFPIFCSQYFLLYCFVLHDRVSQTTISYWAFLVFWYLTGIGIICDCMANFAIFKLHFFVIHIVALFVKNSRFTG